MGAAAPVLENPCAVIITPRDRRHQSHRPFCASQPERSVLRRIQGEKLYLIATPQKRPQNNQNIKTTDDHEYARYFPVAEDLLVERISHAVEKPHRSFR